MNQQNRPLRPVREIEHLEIALSDGCRLAARLWLPEDAEALPVPAILEYIPYRKRDHTAPRDESMHPWIAARGYACLRVDIRGNGESEGLMLDEYLPQELQDGLEVIAWIAAQSWCSGAVGIMGISWGGFNGLQIAALRPPALKAVLTLCSTDDRYADDIHYKGGCLLNDNLAWGATMLAFSSRPPDPALLGERWRERWLQRLENMPFLAANWLRHQRRDTFWEHGSVCEDFAAIETPVLAVGGWADPYSNAVPRLLAGLGASAWGLVGAWGHRYPHLGVPGPAMDFLPEMLSWWDRWLAGRPGAFEKVPAYRAFLLDGPDAGQGADERAGFWITEPAWPSPNVEKRSLFLAGDGSLLERAGASAPLSFSSPLTVGLTAGRFYPRVGRPDLPRDQREDDALSLCFDGPPLPEPLDLFGAPMLRLTLASDRPQALLAARLCTVAPDGTSHRITFGLLNLTHHEGHAAPAALTPGRRFQVRLQLDDIAYRVPAGWRLRVALSTGYWPMVWPSPARASLTLDAGPARLELPVRPAAAGPEAEFDPPPAGPGAGGGSGVEMLVPPSIERRVTRDLASGLVVVETLDDSGRKRLPAHGLETRLVARERYTIDPADPTSARAETHWTSETARGDWRVSTESRSEMTCDAETFHLRAGLSGSEGGERCFERTWEDSIPRDQV